MPCKTNSDCVSEDRKTTCKLHVSGGELTCQPPTSCDKECEPNEFCNDTNSCIPGKTAPPVDECANNHDCSIKHGEEKPVCKIGEDRKTCVPSDQGNSDCEINEVCAQNGTCQMPLICCIVLRMLP